MIPSEAAAAAKEGAEVIHHLYDDLVHFFQDDNSEIKIAAVLEILYASGIPQGIYTFAHNLAVLERQIQNYLEILGADISTAAIPYQPPLETL